MKKTAAAALALFFALMTGARAEEGHVHRDAAPMAEESGHLHVFQGADATEPQEVEGVGVEEKAGETAELDLVFSDERGRKILLKDFVDRPVIMALVFYHCPQACAMILSSMARVMDAMPAKAGEEYRALAVSFDDEETPEIALRSKANYLKLIEKDFPEDQWKFLTGDPESIAALTRSVGFGYKKTGKHDFIHPNLIIALAPGGKIIRYLYGTRYNPFDVSMALAEASRGTPGISIKKMLTYCFDYDPEGRRYVFKTFRIFGLATLAFLAGFFFFVLRRKKTPKQEP
ncbi:cytochrome c oxidase assembly factor [Candidatus Desulfarcum epimagneticum]|uniref:Cytochrome c oxidase assembly factor n=1 Tax=uncultured Desulfobacteraceae bacterium TaxID=218296 RepID=A0A484HGR4_9BACT|nr:cytochrome c oxidase assembly factor [uncultured Desulfobacteraceae bacterium]